MFDERTDLLPISLAAKIAWLSPLAFRIAFIESYLVDYEPDGVAGRFYVDRGSLSRALGRSITLDEMQNADKTLKPRRTYQRRYRKGMKEREFMQMYRQE